MQIDVLSLPTEPGQPSKILGSSHKESIFSHKAHSWPFHSVSGMVVGIRIPSCILSERQSSLAGKPAELVIERHPFQTAVWGVPERPAAKQKAQPYLLHAPFVVR